MDRIPHNPAVNRFVRYYLHKDRRWFVQALERYYMYKPIVEKELKRENCPVELALLPIIESGYDGDALSKSRAAGYWQFMRETARIYGLKINRYIDERRDIEKSSRAAARYLKRLYHIFGDWELALAAYNGGEGYILRLMKKTGARTFWQLLSTGKLRKETAEFVPKFYAVLKIIRENKLKIGQSKNSLKKIWIPGDINLSSISRYSNINLNLLQQLNPHLLKGKTPNGGAVIYVPFWAAPKILASLDYMTAEKKAKRLGIRFYRGYWKGYTVRKGDTLWRIAKRFNVPLSLIKTVNLIKDNNIKPGEVLLIPSNRLKSRIVLAKPEERAIIYSVGPGDNLWRVSRVFGVRIGRLMKINRTSYTLKPGQKLKIVLEARPGGERT